MKSIAFALMVILSTPSFAVRNRIVDEPSEFRVACSCYGESAIHGFLYQSQRTITQGGATYLARSPGNAGRYLTPYEQSLGEYSRRSQAEAMANRINDTSHHTSDRFRDRTPCRGVYLSSIHGHITPQIVTTDVLSGRASFEADTSIYFNNISPMIDRFERIRLNVPLPQEREVGFLTDCRVIETKRGTDTEIFSRMQSNRNSRPAALRENHPDLPLPLQPPLDPQPQQPQQPFLPQPPPRDPQLDPATH